MRCPICKSPVSDDNEGARPRTYPFCSERCKLIDLGRWLDGKYQIPAVEDDQDESDPSAPARSHDDDGR
jgi:endogenous inhibitor of DNA gyrase (YacG/DUF329 family)